MDIPPPTPGIPAFSPEVVFRSVQGDIKAQRWPQALEGLDKLATVLPGSAAILSLRAKTLRSLGRLTEALACAERLCAAAPGVPAHLNLLGNILKDLGRIDDALNVLGDANSGDLEDLKAAGDWLFALNYSDKLTADELSEAHRRVAGQLEARTAIHTLQKRPLAGRPLRVGFVSYDYCRHSISYFLLPLLRNLDPRRIECIGYSTNAYADNTTELFRKTFHRWVDLAELDAEAMARRIALDQVDVLIDLGGWTGGSRLDLFARRPSPLQFTWLGYPNTTGLTRIDYRIVDACTDPVGEAEALCSERLLRLPGCFLTYAGVPELGPAEARPERPFTFGSFNNHSKLSPSVLDAWAEILHGAPSSQLLLKNSSLGDPSLRQSLLVFFEGRGVSADRIRFLGRIEAELGHLRAYDQVDLALDSFPYNGTTTTCEALWMGVPVLAIEGRCHAARVSASLLRAAGLGEWVVADTQAYVSAAIACAERRRALPDKRELRTRLETSSLCDHASYARAFTEVLEHAAGA